MKLTITLFFSSIILTTIPNIAIGQDSTDPQQHLKIQSFARMHGVHSDKLQGVMRNMIATLMKEPKNENDKIQQEKYLAQLVKRSKQVVAVSKTLDQHVVAEKLNEKETIKFKKLAETLHNEALNAEKLAKLENAEELDASLVRFNQTCVECHRLFREK
jgi:hypothetical protein